MEIIKNELSKVRDRIKNSVLNSDTDKSIIDFLSGNSKMIRSKFALLYLKSSGLNVTDDIVKITSAGEIIHNASLLHDDVLDDAELRRGNATLSKAQGNKLSILAGDYLVSSAIDILLELKNDEILKIFNNCIKNMTTSEIKQFKNRGKTSSEIEYINICKRKTGALFSAILESCALTANIDRNTARDLGETFGICFQIKNDNSEKSIEEDKRNGVHTAIDVLGIEKTKSLLDNYKKKFEKMLKNIPQNDYKKELGDLINYYVR